MPCEDTQGRQCVPDQFHRAVPTKGPASSNVANRRRFQPRQNLSWPCRAASLLASALERLGYEPIEAAVDVRLAARAGEAVAGIGARRGGGRIRSLQAATTAMRHSARCSERIKYCGVALSWHELE